jgi:hypothetical protein
LHEKWHGRCVVFLAASSILCMASAASIVILQYEII